MLLLRPLIAGLLVLPLTACGGADAPDRTGAGGATTAVAGFYPLEFLLRRIGGERVQVTGLAEPGAEPHDLELTPQQVARVAEADLVVYLRGFQPAVDDAVDQQPADRLLDVAAVAPLEQGFVPLEEGELHEDERGADPHVWLDPERFAGLARAVGERLAESDPSGAAEHRRRAGELSAQLLQLDSEMAQGLSRCARKDLVTAHNAFGYLARAYGLVQVGITGLTPEEEPSPARLAEVVELARERQVTTVFFEALVSPKVAQSLAREVGARTAVLDPIEGPPASGDYLTAMRANLAALRSALGCT